MSRPDRTMWADALSVFEELVDLDSRQRADRLAAIGESAPQLRLHLEQLLTADEQADIRLDRLDRVLGSGIRARAGAVSGDPLGMVGQSIDHFRVLRTIGRGGMGVVYEAEDTHLGRAIALKFPLAENALDASAEARFLQEARAAGALDHPNICGILEAGRTDDGQLYFAMPHYDGETLKSRLDREGPVSIQEAVRVARQIAKGLRAAHNRGIIHRDLKPANVMLLPDGQVKILDFGLAKVGDLGLTRSRLIAGTVFYMSPEQVEGEPTGAGSDLWALGVVLYEMLTGRRPFEGEHPLAVAHRIVNADPASISVLRDGVPEGLQRLVARLLSKDPLTRERSADAVLEALEELRLFPPPTSQGAGPAKRATSRARAPRQRTLTAAAMVLLLSIATYLAIGRISAGIPAPTRSIAVLPLQDRSSDGNAGYLAVGLTDVIRTDLSRLRHLTVPSSISSANSDGTEQPTDASARELGVEAMLRGSVFREGDRVRIEVELTRFPGSERLWRKSFESSMSEVMEIPGRVSASVLEALGVRPSSAEQTMVERPATSNPKAYDLFLRGREAELRVLPVPLQQSVPPENVREAQTFYSRARELDPGFAIARARLAVTLMRGASTFDTTSARREQGRLEAERALRLSPGLSEAHQALAEYWGWRGMDIPRSIAEQELALLGKPNSAEMHVALGSRYVLAGRLEDAVTAFESAARLDPRNPWPPAMSALSLLRMRRDVEALKAFDRAIELAPENHMMKVIKGHTYLRVHGVPDTLAAVLVSLPPGWDPDGMATWARYTVLRVQRRHREALAMLNTSRSELSRDGLVYQPLSLMKAEVYHALGDRTSAQEQYERARAFLENSVAVNPSDASIRSSLGLAYAGLGMREEAVREARLAMEMVPLSRSITAATAFMGSAVEVLGRVGDIDEAITLAELLLSMPAGREMTIPFLKIWPGFDPIRSSPRYDQLLRRFEG